MPNEEGTFTDADDVFAVGSKVFIRTITMYYTGRIRAITEGFVILEDAAWIADSGRFSDALKNGTLSEVEPFPDPVAVQKAVIVDVTAWNFELPEEQK